jgi:hypothetical protein
MSSFHNVIYDTVTIVNYDRRKKDMLCGVFTGWGEDELEGERNRWKKENGGFQGAQWGYFGHYKK